MSNKRGVDCSPQGAGHKQAYGEVIKLIDLNVGDRFYWKGEKYSVFLKIKHPKGAYKIPCMEWPQGKTIDMPSGRKVKPIIRHK